MEESLESADRACSTVGCWRLFIACAFPADLHPDLLEWQRAAQRIMLEGVRWVPAHQWHMTLRFLGDVPANQVSQVREGLEAACAGQKSFVLKLEGWGCFPSVQRPRVFWLGFGGEVRTLEHLQARIFEQTMAWGRQQEQGFRAHLTLARIRDGSPAARRGLDRCLDRLPSLPMISWAVEEVVLYRSELQPGGAVHTRIHGCRLQT
ncbi:MAG: RNA 2',3'-cyclic phosphodiesterase [Verrucomicrobiota bacterium]|nr:RNA 2',3'-cyclic phosphodiesterase [Limisphaera sp.]MDW8382761.1 RNA 2',3'-cyclic phosphodiesterase [Verrucomicrobiota bacterium]